MFAARAGLKFATSARLLGVDFGADRKRRIDIRKTRLGKFARRALKKLRPFKDSGGDVAFIHRTGAGPAATYGNACLGTAEGSLAQTRAITAFSLGGSQTGNLDLRLMLADARVDPDPALVLAVDPLFEWAVAVWEARPPLETLQAALLSEAVRLGAKKRPWSGVYGPAGAFLLSAYRLGWAVKSAREVITDDNHELDLLRISPGAVRKLARSSVERWRWRRLARLPGHSSLANGGWLLPIRQALVDPDLNASERAYVKSVCAGCQWPEARLHKNGKSATDKCQRCLAHVGTLEHRHWHCEADKLKRSDLMEPYVRDAVLQTETLTKERLLFPDPGQVLAKIGGSDTHFNYALRPPDDAFTGDLFLDGSGYGQTTAYPRAGWAVVQPSERCEVEGIAFGFAISRLRGAIRSRYSAAELLTPGAYLQ